MPKGLIILLLSSIGWILFCLLVLGVIHSPFIASLTLLSVLSTGIYLVRNL